MLCPASLCLCPAAAAAASLCCEGESSSGAVTTKMLPFHFLVRVCVSVVERGWLEQIQLIKYFTTVGKKNLLKPAFTLLKHGRSVHEQWLYICSPKGFFTQAVSGRWSSVSYILKKLISLWKLLLWSSDIQGCSDSTADSYFASINVVDLVSVAQP